MQIDLKLSEIYLIVKCMCNVIDNERQNLRIINNPNGTFSVAGPGKCRYTNTDLDYSHSIIKRVEELKCKIESMI
jgi:hypothetical protein